MNSQRTLAVRQSALSDQHRAWDWAGQQRTFSGYYRAKSNSGLQFVQACKGNSQANSGLFSPTSAPQSSTGLPLADKMLSWAKVGL